MQWYILIVSSNIQLHNRQLLSSRFLHPIPSQVKGCYYCSVTQLCLIFATPWIAACQDSKSFTIFQMLLKLMFTESVMPSNHLIFCHPFLLLPSILPRIRVFSNESVLCISWPKYGSFSFSISPSNEYSGLISFMMDWLDFLACQVMLKSLLQYHSSKASILWHSISL